MGAIVVGTLAGLALNSWFAFIAVTALLLAAAVYQRDIRWFVPPIRSGS